MRVPQCLAAIRSTAGVITLAFTGALMGLPQQADAHHSFAPLLNADGEETIEVLEGSVRIFRLLNPHGALIVDVTNETGATESWLIELSPASQLAREGWTEDFLSAGDQVTVSVFRSSTPRRARLRAMLVRTKSEAETARLFVSYGIRGDTPVMRRLRQRLPICGIIDPSYLRTECFLVDASVLRAFEEEFPGPMGYVLP